MPLKQKQSSKKNSPKRLRSLNVSPIQQLWLEAMSGPPALRRWMLSMREALRLPPKLTISQWADRERYLSPESSAEPGRWRTVRAEYLRGIMDSISDRSIYRVVCMKAAQCGWTEVINNTCGFYMAHDPAPILVIQPNLETAETWSKDRLGPMLRDTPILRGKVHEKRARDTENTIRQKTFPGGRLAIIGANAPSGLAARPIRLVLADEVDRYELSAGSEGDPLALGAKRQQTFWNRKTLIGSTPVRKETSVIYREWLNSDQRRYFVPCAHCETSQYLKWSNVRWDKSDKGDHLPDTAHYVCEGCGALWDDVDRWAFIKCGEWRTTAPSTGTAGFHVPGFLSSWLTLADIVKEFLRVRHNPYELQVFVNTVLGEPWEDASENIEGVQLESRGENYTINTLPDGIKFLTAGVDVQGDRLEVQVVGFGYHEEMWAVRYEVLYGDPAQNDVWKQLDALLLEGYTSESGRPFRIKSACVDTGGHHANAVIAFCKPRRNRWIFPTKGASGVRPLWPKRPSKTKDKRNEIWLVGVDTGKDSLYGRIRIAYPGPGYLHLPAGHGFDAAYSEQLKSERVETRYKEGRPYRVWVLQPGKRNEALDTFVLAMAARSALPIRLDVVPIPRRAPTSTPAQPVSQPQPLPVPQPAQALATAPAEKPKPNIGIRRLGRRVIRSNYMGVR